MITINSETFIGKIDRELGDIGHVKLKVDSSGTPKALPARNIPLAIRDQVQIELEHLSERNFLIPVTEPTEWVNQMVVVRKPNFKLRIYLNQSAYQGKVQTSNI